MNKGNAAEPIRKKPAKNHGRERPAPFFDRRVNAGRELVRRTVEKRVAGDLAREKQARLVTT